MPVRRPEGAALLVAGHGAPGVGAFDASAVHTLGQIGEALLATGTPWQIRRLTATAGDRNPADRPTLKRSLQELANDPVRVAVLVLLGEIIEVAGELALVTGPEAREYPEDATLPLAWIRNRLGGMKAERLVVVVSACGDGGADRWLGALGTQRGHHVIAIDAPGSGANRLVDALLTGLCGDALDPRTGTVTMASLSTHLARHAQTLQSSAASETVAQPPPLAGLWDVRRSQLAHRVIKRAAGEPEDLTGGVLPGRFRIDRVVARGTFGTVYRARQLAVERDVAIKVLHADIDPSSEDGRLFVHEIRSVGRIDHTNVVRIYQADMTHDGRLFFAMELLDGQDLQTLGAGNKLPRARAVELVRQLLAGLGAAHEAGLVHADIKPANAIVVSRARKPTSTDAPLLSRRKLVVTPAVGVPVDAGLATARGDERERETVRTDIIADGSPAPVTATAVVLAAAGPEPPPGDGGKRRGPPAGGVTSDGVVTDVELVPPPPLPSPGVAAPRANGTGTGLEQAAAHARGSGKVAVLARAAAAAEVDVDERVVLVDFGLARLRAPDKPTESAGGTPAYMAPEQLHEGRVDARSDLFSVALVLVWLMTGWRRPNAYTLVPQLDKIIDDVDLRTVLARALDKDPAKRFQSARELAAALTGTAATAPTADDDTPPFLPFRHLAPLTEADRGRLHGRETDLGLITEHVLYRRAVIYTAPSGTGKTSILRAGLLPRLEALGIHAVYVRCRADSTAAVIAAIAPGAPSIAEAITIFHEQRGGKLILVLDQLEAALIESGATDTTCPASTSKPAASAIERPASTTTPTTTALESQAIRVVPPAADDDVPSRGEDFIEAILGFDRWPKGADVSVLLSVREDYLARLLAYTQAIESNIPVVRLPPLAPEGAHTAIVAPLAEARLTIEPELLDTLLADLQRAAATIAPEMGWGNTPAVFPPHLQLACSVLYEALAPGDRALSLAHYRRLGGFDAIVGEHLDRVIETELDGGRDVVARDLFMALVTGANERAMRPESELLAMVGAKHGAERTLAVLEVLRSRGLVLRVRGDDEPSWELVHDSLVPRVLSWIDRKDLARRRAIELVRYHLRRSTPDSPSLLSRRELRELRPYPRAIDELDDEWQRRDEPVDAWTPSRLVARSKQTLRRRSIFFSSVLVAAIAIGSIGFYRSHVEEQRARAEASLRERDLGRFTLALELFEWDPVKLEAIAVVPTPGIQNWRLHSPDPEDRDQPGPEFDPTWVVHGEARIEGDALVESVEAHGGPAFLVVSRDGCRASIIPLRQLPGYAHREHATVTYRLHVPTCRTSRVDMIEIPAGLFIYGGLGEPPSPLQAQYDETRERRVDLPTFRIDRLEVSNAAFGVFGQMSSFTGIRAAAIADTDELEQAAAPRKPVAGIPWSDARAYCRFVGKELPSSEQWLKAMRGGEQLHGQPNPFPRRNYPWGAPIDPIPAAIKLTATNAKFVATPDAGSHPADASPYGVLDLAGGVTEWTNTPIVGEPGIRIVRGGNYGETTADTLVDFTATENRRGVNFSFLVGMRCAEM